MNSAETALEALTETSGIQETTNLLDRQILSNHNNHNTIGSSDGDIWNTRNNKSFEQANTK